MRKRKHGMFYLSMLIVLFVILIITIINIMRNYEYENQIKEETYYYNTYILGNSEDIINMIVENEQKNFKVEGLDNNLEGLLADITVRDGYVTRIFVKEEIVTGKVLSISDDNVVIEGYDEIEFTDNFKVYSDYNGVKSEQKSKITVGYAVTDFYVENDKICGAVIRKNINADTIRVLIKTSDYKERYHNSIKLSCNNDLIITYGKKTGTIKAGETLELSKECKYLKKKRCKVESAGSNPITVASITRAMGTPEYEGALYVTATDNGLLLVNELELEQYLRYVVPSEMPYSYGVTALEAQALCARTYAYRQILDNACGEYGAHVDDSTSFQVYNNYESAKESDVAISNTYGQIICCENEPIEAYFFSTSCGSTTNADIWGGSQRSYIKGRIVAKDDMELDLTVEKIFDEFIRSDFDAYESDCPYFRWITADITPDEFVQMCIDYNGTDIGDFINITVNERGTGGIIKKLTILGKNSNLIIEGELEVRKAFGCLNKEITLNNDEIITVNILPSAYFVLDKHNDTYRLIGGGYGHGMGMSQNAAKAMADSGITATEIVKFFYNDTEIIELY